MIRRKSNSFIKKEDITQIYNSDRINNRSRDVDVNSDTTQHVSQWAVRLWNYMSCERFILLRSSVSTIKSVWSWLKWQWVLNDYLAYVEIIYLKRESWRELYKWWYEQHVWSCKALLHLKSSLASEVRRVSLLRFIVNYHNVIWLQSFSLKDYVFLYT